MGLYNLGLLIILGTLWGLQFSLLKMATLIHIGEIAFLSATLILITLVYVVVLFFKKQLFKPKISELWYFCIGGTLGYIVPIGSAIYLSHKLQAGTISLAAAAAPVITAAISIGIKHEKISALKLVGVVFGIIAAGIVLWPSIVSISNSDGGVASANIEVLDIIMAVSIPLAYGFDVVYISVFWPSRLTASQVATGETLVSALILLPFAFIFDSFIPLFINEGHMHIVGLFVLISIVEVFLFFYLNKKCGPVFVATGGYISILAGVLWGVLLFDEHHGTLVWFAVVLLCISVWLVREREKNHQVTHF